MEIWLLLHFFPAFSGVGKDSAKWLERIRLCVHVLLLEANIKVIYGSLAVLSLLVIKEIVAPPHYWNKM